MTKKFLFSLFALILTLSAFSQNIQSPVDSSGKPLYSDITPVSGTDVYKFYMNGTGKQGLIDKSGNVILPPSYYYISKNAQNVKGKVLIPVLDGYGHDGFISPEGKEIIPPKYGLKYNPMHHRNFFDPETGLAPVNRGGYLKDNKYGYINADGQLVISYSYDEAGDFSGGYAVVKSGKKAGIIDSGGRVVVPFDYDEIYDLKGTNYTVVRKGNKVGAVDVTGRIIVPVEYKWIAKEFYDVNDKNFRKGSLAMVSKGDDKYGFIDYNGCEVIPCIYKNVSFYPVEGDMYIVCNGKKWGILDAGGKVVVGMTMNAENDARAKRAELAQNHPRPNPQPQPTQLATIDVSGLPSTTTLRQLDLKAGIKSRSQISSWAITVNGQPERGINAVRNDGYDMVINRKINLADGRNVIRIEVSNAAGQKVEERVVVYNASRPDPQPQPVTLARIDFRELPLTTTDRRIDFKAGIKSDSQITSWNLTLNGVLERGINAVKNDGYDMVIDRNLKLVDGENLIRLEVINGSGSAVAERVIVCTAANPSPSPKPQPSERRIALVVGNANYTDSDKRLKNSLNDATDVANKLETLGFDVIRSFDKERKGMEDAIREFGQKSRGYNVALFYYAGHGLSAAGSNYMVPIDANLPDESYVQYNCTNMNLVLDLMDSSSIPMKIVILDACRNNPFARSWSRGASNNGLCVMNAPRGTFISFSTAPGDVALDGKAGERNSPYTAALLQTLDQPNLNINDFFQEVIEKVVTNTGERQNPWISGSFRGKFVFNPK